MENITQKVTDLKKLSAERRQNTLQKPLSPNRQLNSSSGERPASRAEISLLERELEERVRLVLDSNYQRSTDEFGASFNYEPHRESMLVAREKMFAAFGATPQDLKKEPWLDSYVKCESLKLICDEISSRFSDMLGVSSSELGKISRKLRITYKQCFEEMFKTWKELRSTFLQSEDKLKHALKDIDSLNQSLLSKEKEVSSRFDGEINRMNAEFNAERERDREKLLQAELKMDQMSDTLKYLNGIFRNMQVDAAGLKTADLQAQCRQLEKENQDLRAQNVELDEAKVRLASMQHQSKVLDTKIQQLDAEVLKLNSQLNRREEVINNLMEREAIRSAEIEKLQKISKMKDDELLSMDMKDPATSVLCIKCKRSLDDLSNIRQALIGDAQANQLKLQCETYRILLPNLRGRKPHRTTSWIRSCIRSVLVSKLKEDMNLFTIKGDLSTFPSYVYAWYARSTEGLVGSYLTKMLVQCDEDRWGLYYGVKALAKDDPECSIFWSLLDESFGQDGQQYLLFCLSMALTLAGTSLWTQFGAALTQNSSISSKSDNDKAVRPIIWLDIKVAKEAVQRILVKALASHVSAANEAIEALKVRPVQYLQELAEDESGQDKDDASVKEQQEQAAMQPQSSQVEEATHINLFVWLKLMLQQLHADQIHRKAAIRLMFETASVGALTPALPGGSSTSSKGNGAASNASTSNNSHVEYPQFQSICHTLFPQAPVTTIAELYGSCYKAGQGRVSADLFTMYADVRGLFTHSLRMPSLPLLQNFQTMFLDIVHEDHPQFFSQARDLSSDEAVAAAISSKHISPEEVERLEYVRALFGQTKFTYQTAMMIRSKLAVIIHRRLACINPAIRFLAKQVPERWRQLLMEGLQQVQSALEESHMKLQEVQAAELHNPTSAGGNASMGTGKRDSVSNIQYAQSMQRYLYLDGIQPYVAYRKLLSLAVYVKSMNENPLLPTEIFAAPEMKNAEKRIRMAISKAETLLSHLEESILLPYSSDLQASGGNLADGDYEGSLVGPLAAVKDSPDGVTSTYLTTSIVKRYERFHWVRKLLITRRIQMNLRRFLNKDVPVPRSVRLQLSAGYLTSHSERVFNSGSGGGSGGADSSAHYGSTMTTVLKPLKFREVVHEPWWAQTHIAGIMLFKLSHDLDAAQQGVSAITLAQAVVAYFYHMWGSLDVAERCVHDLFSCIRTYRLNAPRLRLFAGFLGDAVHQSDPVAANASTRNSNANSNATAGGARGEFEESVAFALRTPQAVNIYLWLILQVHLEIAKHKDRLLKSFAGTSTTENSVASKSDIAQGMELPCLFPSTDDAMSRQDRKEVWFTESDKLVTVATRFADKIAVILKHKTAAASAQTGPAASSVVHAAFIELTEKLRADSQGRMEVDDFLYVMMTQWAKLQFQFIQKGQSKSAGISGPAINPPPQDFFEDDSLGTAPKIADHSSQPNTRQTIAIKNPSTRKITNMIRQSSTLNLTPDNINEYQKMLDQMQRFQKEQHQQQLSLIRRITMMPLSSLHNIMQSLFKHNSTIAISTGTNAIFSPSDHTHTRNYAAWFIRNIRARRQMLGGPLHSMFHPQPHQHDKVHKKEGGAAAHKDNAEDGNAGSHDIGKLCSRMAVEISSLLKDCILWDSTMSIFLPSIDKPQKLSKAASHAQDIVNVPEVAHSWANIQAMYPPQTIKQITAPAFPEALIQMSKLLFVAYQQPVNALLNKISEDSRYTNDADVRQRVQALRIQLLSLTELFQQVASDLRNQSPRLYVLENMGALEDELQDLRREQQQTQAIASEAHLKVQSLLSSVAELAVLTNQDFPRDTWQFGGKINIERAYVYTLHIKSNLIG